MLHRRRGWFSPALDGPHSGLRALRLQQRSGVTPQQGDMERWKRIGSSRSSFPRSYTSGFLPLPHFLEAGQRRTSEPATGSVESSIQAPPACLHYIYSCRWDTTPSSLYTDGVLKRRFLLWLSSLCLCLNLSICFSGVHELDVMMSRNSARPGADPSPPKTSLT